MSRAATAAAGIGAALVLVLAPLAHAKPAADPQSTIAPAAVAQATPTDEQRRREEYIQRALHPATDPALAGEHVITAANRIEAQIALRSMKDDTARDGGVQITGMQKVPDTNPMGYTDNVVFYGRLGTSKWHGWNPATRATAEMRKADALAPLPAPAPAPAPAATDSDTASTPAAAQPAGELPAAVESDTAVA